MATLDSSKVYKLILLAGQSNALGQSTDYTNLSGAYANFWQETTVRCSQQLQCNSDSKAAACATEWSAFKTARRTHTQGDFGPEIGIARAVPNIETWAAPGNVIIVKCATGATDLANDWDPAAVSGYMLYSRMVEFIENPRQVWAASYEVAGLIWVQGEADAQILAEANAYEANLNNLISEFRTDIGKPTLPVVISRLHASYVTGAYASTVRTAQDDVAAADANVTTVTPTPSLGPDVVHYDEDGYAELGETDLGPALDNFYQPI